MLNVNQISAVNTALERFRLRIDAAKKEAGLGVTDWFFDVLYIGGHPRQDIRDAATGQRLYDVLVHKRNEIIESPDNMNEEALDIISIANRAAGWDRANAIQSFRQATNVPGAIGEAAKKAIEATGTGLKLIPVLVALIIGLYILSFLPRARRA